jgi:outer membrane immunogenic protein
MYRKILLASVGAIALSGSAAFAADLPYRGPPPVYVPPPPIFTWTGIYIGGQIGYAWGNDNVRWSGTSNDGEAAFGTFSSNPQGVIGGAHVGYNLQINQWVLGLEGTVDGTSLSRTVVVPVDDVFGDTPGSFTATSRADIQGSIRGRVGIAWDRALLYATGGVAFSGFNNSITDTTGFVAPAGTSASFSNTRVGWTVGGGIEYAVTNNWSVRAEYRYSDFGHFTDFPFAGALLIPGTVFSATRHLTENQVQVGFSYKFDTWAPYPVVAKY